MGLNFNEKGEFRFGKFDYEKACETAEGYSKFKLDNNKEKLLRLRVQAPKRAELYLRLWANIGPHLRRAAV